MELVVHIHRRPLIHYCPAVAYATTDSWWNTQALERGDLTKAGVPQRRQRRVETSSSTRRNLGMKRGVTHLIWILVLSKQPVGGSEKDYFSSSFPLEGCRFLCTVKPRITAQFGRTEKGAVNRGEQ